MMGVLVVDDEPLALRRLEILLSRRPYVELVGAARDGQQAVRSVRELKPDIVLLDIQMPGLDGFEVAELIRREASPEVIFVTAYDTYAVRAFEAAAVDYLLKPVEMERLDAALGRARAQLATRDAEARADELEALVRTLRGDESQEGGDLWIRERKGQVRIEKSRIDWVEAEGDYVRLHIGERSWLMRATMAAMEKALDPRLFVRVHRSAIVNARRVAFAGGASTGGKYLRLDTGVEIRIGRAYEPRVREFMARPVS
ncbi:LytR/AlgR family response regulator transcription factor [Marinicauda salina]|jgi:DNA-binding LytR/AlgR family response regulator|nr:LytTR family DNA-binding domain-containing protein [Marinicauda salina]